MFETKRFFAGAGFVALTAAPVAALVFPAGAWAQTKTPETQPTKPPAAAKTVAPPTLGAALMRVPWSTEQGVLLTLSPLARIPAAPKVYNTDGGLRPENAGDDDAGPITDAEALAVQEKLQASGAEAGRAPLRLAAVARVWKKRVQTFGSVTTVAPGTVTRLNPKPGPPDLWAHASRSEVMHRFMGTLSAAQWRILGSESGVGRGDLSQEQAALFDKLLPDPLTYTRTNTHYLGRVNDPAQTHTLTINERQAVRVRVKLQTNVDAPRLDANAAGSFFPVLFDGNRDGGIFGDRKTAPLFLSLVGDDQYHAYDDEYGVLLSEEVRSKLKDSDLDFAHVSGVISLAPPSPATPLTIADVLPRLREATGLDLFADARLDKQVIWTRGSQSVRAADLLPALCFAIGGAVRKLEAPNQKPAYVLTNDREGIAARALVLSDWESAAQKAKNAMEQNTDAIRKIKPLSFLQFDENEPVKLAPALIARIVESTNRPDGLRGRILIKPTELTPLQQTYLQKQVAASDTHKPYYVGGDKFRLSVSLWVGIVIPGVGEITNSPLDFIAAFAPDAPTPPLPPARGASLWARVPGGSDAAAKNAAREVVTVAAAHKLRVLYLDGASPDVLQAAIEQAKGAVSLPANAPLAVWAVLRPLRSRSNDGVPVDVNAANQTTTQYAQSRTAAKYSTSASAHDWRDLSRPEAQKAAQKEVAEIADISGLGGILIADALPPGYLNDPQSEGRGFDSSPGSELGTGAELGWTPENRFAFLHEIHCDPADIVPYETGPSITMFSENEASFALAWSKWRAKRGQGFLTVLRRTLEAAHPGLPVRVCGQISVSEWFGAQEMNWVSDWTLLAVGNVPLLRFQTNGKTPLSQQMRQGVDKTAPKLPAFLCVSPQKTGEAWKRGGVGWDGLVFDFSNEPTQDAAQIGAFLETLP